MGKAFLTILLVLVAGAVWAAEVKKPSLLGLQLSKSLSENGVEPSLLGLQLGKSLSENGVPECAKKPYYDSFHFLYTNEDTTLCWQADSGYFEYKNPYVILSTKGYFNLAKMAAVVLDRAAVNPASDKIIQASLNFAPDNARILIDMLKEKFGKPVFEDASMVQNKLGAKFERLRAVWDFRTARIELDSRYSINDGQIYLKPGSYVEERRKTLEEIKSDKEKL